MLNSYFNKDEKVYLHYSFNGERYSRKDTYLFVIGLICGLIAVACLILAVLFTWTILVPFVISASMAAALLGFFFKLNKRHFTKNENIYIEYAITNKRFLFIEKDISNILEIPITDFSKVLVRSNLHQVSSLVLRLEKYCNIPVEIDNDLVHVSSNEIVIDDVGNPYMLKVKLEFLIYLYKHRIDDIYDIDNFLEPYESVLYTDDCKNAYTTQYLNMRDKKILMIGIIIFIVINACYEVEFLVEITPWFLLLLIFFILKKRNSIMNYFKYKIKPADGNTNTPPNYNYHLRYVITDKRVLFFDFNLTVLYILKLDKLDYINVVNYDKKNDVGDIYLSNTDYSRYITRHVNHGHRYMENIYAYFFPNNYFENKILFNVDWNDCCKLRLYNVKNPHSVVNNYLNKHIINNQNKNTK